MDDNIILVSSVPWIFDEAGMMGNSVDKNLTIPENFGSPLDSHSQVRSNDNWQNAVNTVLDQWR